MTKATRRLARIRLGALVLLAASAADPWARAARGAPEDPARPKGEPEHVRSRDGTRIAFERSGKGPVVILVSGALSARADGARLAEALSSDLSVVRYDRRGRGDSTDTKPYAVEREVEDLEALVDRVGGSASLFGSSSGAALAIEAARRLPAKVSRLALFEPPFVVDDARPPIPEDLAAKVARLVADGKRSEAVQLFMTEAVRVPAEFLPRMRQSPMWPPMVALAHTLEYDFLVMGDTQRGKPLPRDRWTSVRAPTLVIDGERSDAYLRSAVAALVDVVPNARRKTLPGQDHSAVFMAPESLEPMLVEFFTAKADRAPHDVPGAGGR